ncbi:MAG: rhomboid family intramembrane serine protease [Candidatus Micrarchaeota archaeon]
MKEEKRFPFASTVLVGTVLIVYLLLSAETPYITEEGLDKFSLNPNEPLSVVTHLFIHVGIFHLIGNIVPLLLFALVLESAAVAIDVFLIFFASGIIASLLFQLTNQGVPLIGASAAISGLLSATMLVKPKKALFLLIVTPILISAVLYPAADYGEKFFKENLEDKRVAQEMTLTKAIEEGKPPEVIMQINQTLQATSEKIAITQEGQEREESTPSDFMVHIYGALIGAFYIYFLKRNLLKAAEKEFVEIGSWMFMALDWVQRKAKRR